MVTGWYIPLILGNKNMLGSSEGQWGVECVRTSDSDGGL